MTKIKTTTIIKAHVSTALTIFGCVGILMSSDPMIRFVCLLALIYSGQFSLDARISLIEQRLEPENEKADSQGSEEPK